MASSMKLLKKPNKEEIKVLLDRGVTDIVDRAHLESALLSGRRLRVKLGFDPTGAQIHIGRAIILRKLQEFQKLGHQIVFIVGDFTARIGDPSDKLSKRPMLSKEQIKKNIKNYKSQVGKIIDLKTAEFKFNSAWLKKLNLEEVAELAESFTVGQMLERRNFSERLKKGEEISLRELLYPLMQGYDSVVVKADLELGGFDQLFNLHAGRVIQRYYNQKEQDTLTCAMLEGTDGRKMSTSWGNVINIMDKPSDIFGKVMSVRDELIIKYFLLCTDVDEAEIKKIEKDIKSGKLNPRDVKARLATEIVSIYHGDKKATLAKKEFDAVFKDKQIPSKIDKISLAYSSVNIIDILVLSKMITSKSEARRLIEQGGVKIDGEKIIDSKKEITLTEQGVVIQAGKHKFVKIIKK